MKCSLLRRNINGQETVEHIFNLIKNEKDENGNNEILLF